ncbi:MAG: hypothetical protein BWX63_02342 [Bacteroidetes bacterium ADurb.Bin041]|nr:MAG: hypothetical protein BWX63_02342 [Bacteroidetes bacterium ADurb.Bin041]
MRYNCQKVLDNINRIFISVFMKSEGFCRNYGKAIKDCREKEFMKMKNNGFKLNSSKRNGFFARQEKNDSVFLMKKYRYIWLRSVVTGLFLIYLRLSKDVISVPLLLFRKREHYHWGGVSIKQSGKQFFTTTY